jgi:hypothetical protein
LQGKAVVMDSALRAPKNSQLGFEVIDTRSETGNFSEVRSGEENDHRKHRHRRELGHRATKTRLGISPNQLCGVRHARDMCADDGILFYRGQKGAKESGIPSGFVALGRLTEDAQYPWPSGVPVPWSDSDYAVRLPMELTSLFDPPLQLPWTGGGFSEEVGISRFDLLGGVISEDQVQKIIDTGISNGSTPKPSAASSSVSTSLGLKYKPPRSSGNRKQPDPFTHDPEVIERGTKGHIDTQNALADFLESKGINPRRPDSKSGEPRYDLAWEHDDASFVAEVKSITRSNEERQLRLGLGQVLRYQDLLRISGWDCSTVLVAELEPADSSWKELCDHLGIELVWPGNFSSLA